MEANPKFVLQMVDIGPGKIIYFANQDQFLNSVYSQFNNFAMAVAASDKYIGDMDEELIQIKLNLQSLSENGIDISEVDPRLQARYAKVISDCGELMAGLVVSMVSDHYSNQSKIIVR